MFKILFPILICIGVFVQKISGDTPASCRYEDVLGEWLFYESERSGDSYLHCDTMVPVYKKRIRLYYPDLAYDLDLSSTGHWTMIYNQGFEVTINQRSYFAFSLYKDHSNGTVESLCDQTLNGWSRDTTVRNWSCFRGRKTVSTKPKFHVKKLLTGEEEQRAYRPNIKFVNSINEKQKSWTANIYKDHYAEFSLLDVQRRAGKLESSGLPIMSKKVPIRHQWWFYKWLIGSTDETLPVSFDWRNQSGINYVTPIRNQGKCGSCYAFASMAVLESRVRIATDGKQQPIFSPQDIVGCSKLSQGCEGGFPYLIAGRYGQDLGVVVEDCYPYEGKDDVCRRMRSCLKHYTAHYKYVGGYFGGCSELEMKRALVTGGPLAIGFEVYNDFLHYKNGVYHHTGIKDKFNPLELTNHAVLVVGYGHDPLLQEDYWIVKNSWGTDWGEDGYFRIRRGSDECGCESMAVEVTPIPA